MVNYVDPDQRPCDVASDLGCYSLRRRICPYARCKCGKLYTRNNACEVIIIWKYICWSNQSQQLRVFTVGSSVNP